ncbi:hypothetical protein PLESTB_000183100 [Pleodorina starrii]|uniref:Uncharacterized protein n=1 Tax=Pleodorina starrii TaxID=330485 RepID=A0A9W6BBI3_9CHLO|nr:hypothetical protein PLESTB_000183100 [Pleodorina starrii]GLC66099.1 hypothetical protein PLESTF_000384600 [Pleodorina starrii]
MPFGQGFLGLGAHRLAGNPTQAPRPAVISDLTGTDSKIVAGADDAALHAALGLNEDGAGSDTDGGSDDPNQLALEQLESRRISSRTASTSTSASSSTSSLDGGPPGLHRPVGGGSGASPPAFPAFPRPRAVAAGGGSATAPAGRPAGPSPPAQVPAEAAQLYAGSSIAGNLSATTASADALVPLLDSLQLEPPSGPGGASNVQRVYRTATASASAEQAAAGSAAGGAEGAGGGAAGAAGAAPGAGSAPLKVQRKRARTRVVDTSELLLARDEAVRTELISRTWSGLLRFEERLSSAPGAAAGAPAPAPIGEPRATAAPVPAPAVAAAPAVATPDGEGPSPPGGLQDVLGFLLEAAEAQKDMQLEERETQLVRQRKELARAVRIMWHIRSAPTWGRLARLFLNQGRAFSVDHLVATLERLARFRADGHVGRLRNRRSAFDRVWDMLTRRVAFAAPRMSGLDLVRVVHALNRLPLTHRPRAEHTLLAVQRVLRHSQRALPPPPEGGGGGAADAGPGRPGGGGSGGERFILNASEVARQRNRGRTAAAGAAARRGWGLASGEFEAEEEAEAGPRALSGAQYASLCYALGRMNLRARPCRLSLLLSRSICRRLLLGSYSMLGSLGPREFAGLLYGLSGMRLSPPRWWMYAFYVSSVRALPAMTDVQMTMMIYGACRVKGKPPPAWIESYLEALGPRLRELDGAGLATLAHALGRLRYKPRPAWVEAFMVPTAEVLARRGMSGVEMSQLVRGLMFLGLRPPEDVLEALWEASGRAMEAGEFSMAQLTNLAWALGMLKVPIPRPWYDQLMTQVNRNYKRLQHQRPYHRRRLLSALQAFGCRNLSYYYELLMIPLTDMPNYAAWAAKQAKLRLAAPQQPQQQPVSHTKLQQQPQPQQQQTQQQKESLSQQQQGQQLQQGQPAVKQQPAYGTQAQPGEGVQGQAVEVVVAAGTDGVVAPAAVAVVKQKTRRWRRGKKKAGERSLPQAQQQDSTQGVQT